MAEYSNLSATINAQIRANGVQAITGPVLNAVLTAMVNVLGDGYRLAGVAHPGDTPGSPDNRVAYLAAEDGTYTNFGGLTVSGEVALLLWDSAWTKAVLVTIDSAVTPGSDNLVTSGAVDSAISALATAYMQLVPGATGDNLASFAAGGQVRDAGLATSDLATKDGHYPDLFAGFAGNLVDTRSAGTHQSFAFRQSGGDGVNYMRKILGRTEVFNQLAQNGNFSDGTTNWQAGTGVSLSVSGGVMTATRPAEGSAVLGNLTQDYNFINGHIYCLAFRVKSGNSATKVAALIGGDTVSSYASYNDWSSVAAVYTASGSPTKFQLRGYNNADPTSDVVFLVDSVILVDLTLQSLGFTTAAQFRALHPLGYYSPASKLINNAATGLVTTGFNQWDEEWEVGSIDNAGQPVPNANRIRTKNFIPVFSNTTYYAKVGQSASTTLYIVPYFYDGDGNFISSGASLQNATFTTPENCRFVKFFEWGNDITYNTYNHDICINRSDASRNGTYEPYWKREIVLGLNSLPCHDENNNAVVVNGLDGVGTSQDELVVENGWGTKINKRRKRVDLGGLNWTYVGAPIEKFYTDVDATFKDVASNAKANLLCQKYETNTNDAIADKQIASYSQRIYVKDSAYTDAPTFKAAMSGVYADVELATPKVLTLDNPIPALIEVDNLGTEKRLPEDTADNPQAPFECDSNYSVSTANLVRLLNL